MKKISKLLYGILRFLFLLRAQVDCYFLKKYQNDVVSIKDCEPSNGQKTYAIFVYYEPNGKVSKSANNILSALQSCHVDTILMCNHVLSKAQEDAISPLVHKIVLRGNQGFDFGAYKDGANYLKENKLDVERAIFLNDSIYYFSKGLDVFVDQMLEDNDVISAFENWEEPHEYHLQSFALSVSNKVFNSESFSSFWQNYMPVSSRLYAIERGEKGLSKAILKAAENVKVIYSVSKIAAIFDQIAPEGIERFMSVPRIVRDGINGGNSITKSNDDEGADILDSLETFKVVEMIGTNPYSPIHSGAYYFAKAQCPLVKKDLVYRGVFNFWELETIYGNCFDASELQEFLSFMRKKGNKHSLSKWQRIKYNVGAL